MQSEFYKKKNTDKNKGLVNVIESGLVQRNQRKKNDSYCI